MQSMARSAAILGTISAAAWAAEPQLRGSTEPAANRTLRVQLLPYCVDIVTGTSGNNDGTLDVVIQSKTIRNPLLGPDSLRELSGGYYHKGETVLQECFPEDVEVLVKNPTSNAWTGSIIMSTDGGSTYFPAVCRDCTGGFGTSPQIVVDGNADSGDQASVACFNGRQCVVIPQAPQYCVDIVTGTSGNNDGTLDVVIQSKTSRASLRDLSGGYYHNGEIVLQQCFSEDFEVLVSNPTSNAWTGSIEMSPNGGSTYFPGVCRDCTGGFGIAPQIVVDGNADSGDQASVRCFNGKQCVVVPSVAFTR